MAFKIGDKVRCIDTSIHDYSFGGNDILKLNKTYTIIEMVGDKGLRLENTGTWFFKADRFKDSVCEERKQKLKEINGI